MKLHYGMHATLLSPMLTDLAFIGVTGGLSADDHLISQFRVDRGK
jgi:hypothetical protein